MALARGVLQMTFKCGESRDSSLIAFYSARVFLTVFFQKRFIYFLFFFFVCLLTNVDCLDTLALAMPKRKSPLGESKREMQKVFKSIAHLNKNYGRVARLPGCQVNPQVHSPQSRLT